LGLFVLKLADPTKVSGSIKMNDADVSKQIQQMVQFIKQEAEEKANEIAVATEEVSLTS
jgi:hypothetical protein